MSLLTMEQISRENQCRDVASVTSLQLSHRALSDVSCLSSFQNLEKLDISYNCLTSLEGLSACVNLKWLQVFENKLTTLKGIECLSKLTVLNVGRNKLEKMDEICALTNLRALILNDNNISSICKLDQMKYLNTLVLSRNPIHVIGNSLEMVTSMVKLSLSHCKLETIGSSLVACMELKEARFSHNMITALPEELAKNVRLRTLDIGNNLIENLSEIKVLSDLPNLKNLNLLGNPIAVNDKFIKKVRRLVPNVLIFNSKPTENSNSYAKASKKDSLHSSKADSSLDISFDAEDSKKRKKNGSKRDDTLGRKVQNDSAEETIADDSLLGNIIDIVTERKKKSINSETDFYNSETKTSKNSNKEYFTTYSGALTDNASVSKEAKKKKKSASSTELSEVQVRKSNSTLEENISNQVEQKPKRKKSSVAEGGAIFNEFDDAETPFADLIVSGKIAEDLGREKGREAQVVVESSKKPKKRSKNMVSGLSAIFSSKHEIGMGGISTWDA